MTPQERINRLMEYWRVQEDLDAILNVPVDMKVDWRHWETVRWLENRLRELSNLLSQQKVS